MIHEMENVENFELCETTSEARCSHSLSCWTKVIVYCTCGTCMCLTDKTRKLNKDRFDTLSIPNCVIEKGPAHGARHGNTEEQRIYHVAHNAYKRCLKKKYDGIFDRFLNNPRYRASQTEHGWTEELCAKYDALAQEDHSYTYTAWEHRRLASTWKLQSKTDRWQNDLIMQKQYLSKIAHIKNQVKRRREFIPVNKVDSEVTTHSQKQVQRVRVWTAKRDGGGIRHSLHGMLLNLGGHRLVGTRREVDTHVTFSRTLSCVAYVCVAHVCACVIRKSFPSMSHERAFLIPRFTLQLHSCPALLS